MLLASTISGLFLNDVTQERGICFWTYKNEKNAEHDVAQVGEDMVEVGHQAKFLSAPKIEVAQVLKSENKSGQQKLEIYRS